MSGLPDAQLWWIALGAGVAVELVVWVLLAQIASSAGRIRRTLEEIWVAGPKVANNTAHVDVLRYINRTAGEVLAAAGGIAANTEKIHRHASGCPGCPRCVIGWSGGEGEAVPGGPTGGAGPRPTS